MNKIVAVSGGVDSVVLLDKLLKENPDNRYVVAHFDHGIRDDSADDAVFVKNLAMTYKLPFETKREELGRQASEELARERRYGFLRQLARKYGATIVTAHHADDVIETVAINLTRGTGWRGLAVLNSDDIERPLLKLRKKEILEYAKKNQLTWREDSTNSEQAYLRNRIRRKTHRLDDDTVNQILALRDHQVSNKQAIDREVKNVTPLPYSRYFFSGVENRVAIEVLRAIFIEKLNTAPHRGQLANILVAIKTLDAGKKYPVHDGIELRFTRRTFEIIG